MVQEAFRLRASGFRLQASAFGFWLLEILLAPLRWTAEGGCPYISGSTFRGSTFCRLTLCRLTFGLTYVLQISLAGGVGGLGGFYGGG